MTLLQLEVRLWSADEERMRPGHWLWIVLCVPLSALMMIVEWQEGHPLYMNPVQTIALGPPLLEHVEEEHLSGKPADPGSPGKRAVKWK